MLPEKSRKRTYQLSLTSLIHIKTRFLLSAEVLDTHRDLEVFLRQADNSEERIKFWMGYCLYLEGDEDGDLRSVVAIDAALAALQGYLVVG